MYLNSLIIINYNNANLTIQTLQSIYKHKHNEQIEVILIDNASKIDDYTIIEKYVFDNHDLNIVLYRSRINVGFGAGNMLGVNLANGKYYTFINNDVIIIEETFNKLTSFLEQNNDVSVVGCQAIDEDRIKYKTFDYQLSLATELFSTSFLHFLSKKKYPNRLAMFSEPTQVGAVPGSLFTCRATDFNAVGGFDTSLFLYYEEKDLSFRINKQLGKKTFSIPNINYIHLKGKSTDKSIDIRRELKISQFYCVRKNLGFFNYQIFFLISFLIFLIKSPFSKKNFSYLKLVLIGIPTSESLKYNQNIIKK